MEWVTLAAAVAGGLVALWKAYNAHGHTKDDLSNFSVNGLQVSGESGTETDHFLVGESEAGLKVSQVGDVNVFNLRRVPRSFDPFAWCRRRRGRGRKGL